MGICLFKSQVDYYKLKQSQLQLQQMSNMHDLDDIKERLEYKENEASEKDSACATTAANAGKSYSQNYFVKAWHDTTEYKQLIADENELEFQNDSLDTELEMLGDMIDNFEKGEQDEIKSSCNLFAISGG